MPNVWHQNILLAHALTIVLDSQDITVKLQLRIKAA